MFSIKKDTLFYYDKIGLFSPAYRKGTMNYRYYESKQLTLLATILVLRDLDIPIEELKSYLGDMNNDSFLSLMKLENEKINARIKDLETKKLMINGLNKKMQDALKAEYNKLYIKIQKEREYYVSEAIIHSDDPDNDWEKAQDRIFKKYDSPKIMTFGSIIERENFINGISSVPSHAVAYSIEKTENFLEKGLWAKLYYKGQYDNIDEAYKRMKSLLDISEYRAVSDVYEEYIITALSEKNENGYITLISVMVEKKA